MGDIYVNFVKAVVFHEVADFLDIGQSTLSLWESDKSTPQVEYLPKLAEILKVDIYELLPLGTTVKIVNSNSRTDNSVVGFEIRMDGHELFKDLLSSKDEIIRMLREEIKKLSQNAPRSDFQKVLLFYGRS